MPVSRLHASTVPVWGKHAKIFNKMQGHNFTSCQMQKPCTILADFSMMSFE
jgi:hypothetical protein